MDAMPDCESEFACRTWDALASSVLDGRPLVAAEALSVLECPDLELPALLAATYRVRHRYWGNEVQLYSLRNAKSEIDIAKAQSELAVAVAEMAALRKYLQKK